MRSCVEWNYFCASVELDDVKNKALLVHVFGLQAVEWLCARGVYAAAGIIVHTATVAAAGITEHTAQPLI